MFDSLFEIHQVEAMLRAAAADSRSLSYSEALAAFGVPFSRPKMRAFCTVLTSVDARAAAMGEPELAVLVVRACDGLPGQGWWIGRTDWKGPWDGAKARGHVRKLHLTAYRFWRNSEAANFKFLADST